MKNQNKFNFAEYCKEHFLNGLQKSINKWWESGHDAAMGYPAKRFSIEIEEYMGWGMFASVRDTGKYIHNQIEYKVEHFSWNMNSRMCKLKLYLDA